MHTAHLLETLQEFQSRRRIGWIKQDFWEMCVSRSLTFRLETKMPWHQTPSRKKKAILFTTDNERLSGSNKHSFHCPLLLQHFYTPLNMTQHKMKHDWLLYLSVIWLHRPSAVSLKVWLHETRRNSTPIFSDLSESENVKWNELLFINIYYLI